MPRVGRIKSASGYYHVMLRAIDRQTIFKDREDYEKFRALFNSFRTKYKIQLLAWCMIPNHVHLLIRDPSESISDFFRVLGTSFVYWYNAKYQRVGHLFQDRFRSEPVEDGTYLLRAIRYIHLNPVHHKICREPDGYKYSSYHYYFHSDSYSADHELFGLITAKDFYQFHQEKNDDKFLDFDDEIILHLTDEEAKRMLTHAIEPIEISQIKTLPQDQQKNLVQMLRIRGASFHQIYRLTGISIRMIQNLLQKS